MAHKFPISKPHAVSETDRAKLTIACADCDAIPKHRSAGELEVAEDGTKWQVMHNGLRVEYGGYHGEWMATIIRNLKGHHEPQEEYAFWEVLKRIEGEPVMIELGAYWGYYSLWFKKNFDRGKCFLYEPDSAHIALGKRNFAKNGLEGFFEVAAAGTDGDVTFYDETQLRWRPVVAKSVARICCEREIRFVDVLHMDVQGAELDALFGAEALIEQGRLRFVFVSTHHHRISNDPLTHQRCLRWLKDHGAFVICEHSVHESFSGDALIVASFCSEDSGWTLEVSRCRQSTSLFRELEFDLADALENK